MKLITPHKIILYMLMLIVINHVFAFICLNTGLYTVIVGVMFFFINWRIQTLFEVCGLFNSIMFKYLNYFEQKYLDTFSIKDHNRNSVVEDIRKETAELVKKTIHHSEFVIFLHNVRLLHEYYFEGLELDKKISEIKFSNILKGNLDDIEEKLLIEKRASFYEAYKQLQTTNFKFKNVRNFSSAKLKINFFLIKEFVKIF